MKAKETLREAQFEAELEEAEAQRLEEEVICPHSRIPLFLYYYFYFKSIYLFVLLLPRYLFLFYFITLWFTRCLASEQCTLRSLDLTSLLSPWAAQAVGR